MRAALIGLIACVSSCNEIAGIGEGTLIEEGPPAECAAVEDCIVEVPECRTAVACEGSSCVFDDAMDGTPLAEQTPGDCAEIVCDGAGSTRLVHVGTDTEDDDDPCTLDSCNGTIPTHTVQAVVSCYAGPPGTERVGICKGGMQHCSAQGNPIGGCEGEVLPGTETCISSGDEDCDGQVNEEGQGCACHPGDITSCYTGPMGTEDVGPCHAGLQSCKADGLGYGTCIGDQTPQLETCDAAEVDEDCDGEVNEEGANCVCGDGYVSMGETCDDGGTSDGDPCSSICRVQEVLQVAIGGSHTCAVLTGGVVKCWGLNNGGQLGLGDTANRGVGPNQMGDNLPGVNLGTGMTALAISAGTWHTCALLNDATVKCWGANGYGQLGLGDVTNRGDGPNLMGDNLPAVSLGGGKTALAISAGGFHTCAVLNDFSVKCWGYGAGGDLGLGDSTNRGDEADEMGDNLPTVSLGSGKTALAISVGNYHTCAVLNDSSVKCWGINDAGRLGLGDSANRGDGPNEMGDNLPAVSLGTGKTAIAISAGSAHTCTLLNDSSVKCWGANGTGLLGLGDTANRGDGPNEMGDNLPAVSLGTGKVALTASAGIVHTCALLNDASVKCWGRGLNGRLGLGDTANRGDGPNDMGDNLPAVSLGMGKTVMAISTGENHTCVLLNDSSIKCWGYNYAGQLGLGDTEDRGDGPNEMGDSLPTVKLFSALW